VKKDGGDIDAIAGATISSRAVAQGVELAAAFYEKHADTIRKALGE
jgi:Na+-translocating ferredoxin:NAD+ oxidoreductase RnfG subunit